MTSAEVQLAWYAAALEELRAFLLSGEVVWTMEHPPAQLRQDLSVGGLLLIRDNLHTQSGLSASAQRRLDELDRRWEGLRRTHAVALERKAEQEVRMRVNLWRAYLTDLSGRRGMAEEYPYQVRQRAMIERLAELGAVADPSDMDDRLREIFHPAPFVWEAGLERAYPKDRYWFLYGRPEAEG
jgi:hypothetical protein